RVRDALPDLADVVDGGVRRRIELEDVEGRTFRDLAAPRALAARRRRHALLAVERFREDPRGRRLPGPARPGEEVRVREPVLLDGADQGLGHVRLAEHLLEGRGPPPPVEGQITHRITLRPTP